MSDYFTPPAKKRLPGSRKASALALPWHRSIPLQGSQIPSNWNEKGSSDVSSKISANSTIDFICFIPHVTRRKDETHGRSVDPHAHNLNPRRFNPTLNNVPRQLFSFYFVLAFVPSEIILHSLRICLKSSLTSPYLVCW